MKKEDVYKGKNMVNLGYKESTIQSTMKRRGYNSNKGTVLLTINRSSSINSDED